MFVDIISNPKLGRHQTLHNKLNFVAKGFTHTSPMIANIQQIGISNATVNNTVLPLSHALMQATPMNTAQNPSQIALLYPAPCVVMAVPYKTSPFLNSN